MSPREPLVTVQDLSVAYRTGDGWIDAISDVSFDIHQGEVLGLVGESGCGKSTLALTLLGYRHPRSRIATGGVTLIGRDLLTLPPKALSELRGKQVSFVPQNPTTALNPARRVGELVIEVLLAHGAASSTGMAKERVIDLFAQVGLPQSSDLMRRFPHQLSGGQQQRVCIAIALACKPDLVVLDEPTTGLDVTTQEQIIDLLGDLKHQLGMSMLYVTHDLAVLAQIADRVGVLYAGRLVEVAPTSILFTEPRHPYTRGLIASVPRLRPDDDVPAPGALRGLLRRAELPQGCPFQVRCDFAEPSCATNVQRLETIAEGHQVACQRWRDITRPEIYGDDEPETTFKPISSESILTLQNVTVGYGGRGSHWGRLFGRRSLAVVHDASFHIQQGETFALVGESGSGKSTIARAISGLLTTESGKILFQGEPVSGRIEARSQELRRLIQYVFQNPDASLNPRMQIGRILARPLELLGDVEKEDIPPRVATALEDVRLDPGYAGRYPDQLSGGERQRVAIARALIVRPVLLLCDEILSALDVSVQANILDLLRSLRSEHKVSMLFISHDIVVVRTLADHIGVMYRGQLLEIGSNEEVFAPPFHPYTHMLLSAVPSLKPRHRAIDRPLQTSSAKSGPGGCAFAGRCPWQIGSICEDTAPPWRDAGGGLRLRCHHEIDELYRRAEWAPQDSADEGPPGAAESP